MHAARAAAAPTATATVADPAVRHRGTFGGSLAHADPAGDLPAVALALDAELVADGPRRPAQHRRRRTSSSTTWRRRCRPDEMLVAVRVPKLAGPAGASTTRSSTGVAQAWAIVGVAAAVRRTNGAIAEARVGADQHGLDARARRGRRGGARGGADPAAVTAAARRRRTGTNPPSDLGARPTTAQHLARVLTARAVANAAGMSS